MIGIRVKVRREVESSKNHSGGFPAKQTRTQLSTGKFGNYESHGNRHPLGKKVIDPLASGNFATVIIFREPERSVLKKERKRKRKRDKGRFR